MKTKIIIPIGVVIILILSTAIFSFFSLKEQNSTSEIMNNNLQTEQDPSICMVDTGCEDESITGSKITGSVIKEVNSDNLVVVYFFWGDGCPHCAEEEPFLDSLKQKYPSLDVKMFETWYNRENADLFQRMAELFGTSAQGVPTTFIGDRYWVGFAEYMEPEIENYIEYCLENGCTN